MNKNIIQSEPIVEKTIAETVVIKHEEPVVVNKVVEQTEVKEHVKPAIVQTHYEAPIIKQEHQDVIHEHHKEVITEVHKDVINKIHQEVIHEFHQPVIHEKHVHEIHQPIIHKVEQDVIHEKAKEIVHEKREGFVHEKVADVKTHEHFEKPIVATSEVKAPIIEKEVLRTEHFVEEHLEPLEQHKKGFTQKVKEFFKGGETGDTHMTTTSTSHTTKQFKK